MNSISSTEYDVEWVHKQSKWNFARISLSLSLFLPRSLFRLCLFDQTLYVIRRIINLDRTSNYIKRDP